MDAVQKWLMATGMLALVVSMFGFVPLLMGYKTAALWMLGGGLAASTLLILAACFLMVLED